MQYIFFSEDLMADQLKKKERKFQKALEKGEKIEKKIRRGKDIGQKGQ